MGISLIGAAVAEAIETGTERTGRGRRLVVVVLGPDHAHALLRVEVARMAVVVAAGGLRPDVTDLDHVPRRSGSGGHDQGQGHDRLRKADAVAGAGAGAGAGAEVEVEVQKGANFNRRL